MPRNDHRDAAQVAEQAARAGGAIVRAAALGDGPVDVRSKRPTDLVTEVDLASEDAVRAALARLSPGVPILAEEGGGPWGAQTRWLVDPLDGTTNFVHGYPSFAVSIALQQDGALVAGCVYDPLHDTAYTAWAGGGAWCGERRLAVSRVETLDAALLVTGFPYDRVTRADVYLRYVEAFMRRSHGIRRMGAAAIDFAHLAMGSSDGFWEFGLQPWDMAAGALLITEAGGQVSDMGGGPLDLEQPRIVASNGRIHSALLSILADVSDEGPEPHAPAGGRPAG